MKHDLPPVNTWTAIVTPLFSDGSLDLESLKRLVQRQEDAGCGILLLGSTGEGLAFTDEEKRIIVTTACALQPKVPLMVTVGGFQLPAVLAWIEFCNKLPISGYLLTTPIYARPGPKGQAHWFQTLLDLAAHPCVIYNHPGRSGTPLAFETVSSIRNYPNFYGIKEASGNPKNVAQFKECAPKVAVLLGCDELIFPYIQAGAVGMISVIGNLFPRETRDIIDGAINGKILTPSENWQKTVSLSNRYNPVSVKKFLHKMGFISHHTLRPPLSEEEVSLDNLELLL